MIFSYKRVSTANQSVDRQLRGIKIDREYIDVMSGKNTDRPQLQALLGSLREGDVIHVHELSRLARNTKDLLDTVGQIVKLGASIKFHKENLSFDGRTSSPIQKLMLSMLGSIAQFERDLLLERQREGIALAKQRGVYKGRKSKFSESDIRKIKEEFKRTDNKTDLARRLKITRAYLYRLVKK